MPSTGATVAPDRLSAVLVDFDNFYPGPVDSHEGIVHQMNRMISLVLDQAPTTAELQIRIYGGWLNEGLLTRRGSELQAAISGSIFPMPHPFGDGLLRGSVTLVTRLVALPEFEWGHTHRERRGLPRLQLADSPRPGGCFQADSCPMDLLQRITRRSQRECHVDGCAVKNEEAFVLREQKMVDSMICCDLIALSAGGATLIVMSDDLDVVPAVAMAASNGTRTVALVRSDEEVESLYAGELTDLGVADVAWNAL